MFTTIFLTSGSCYDCLWQQHQCCWTHRGPHDLFWCEYLVVNTCFYSYLLPLPLFFILFPIFLSLIYICVCLYACAQFLVALLDETTMEVQKEKQTGDPQHQIPQDSMNRDGEQPVRVSRDPPALYAPYACITKWFNNPAEHMMWCDVMWCDVIWCVMYFFVNRPHPWTLLIQSLSLFVSSINEQKYCSFIIFFAHLHANPHRYYHIYTYKPRLFNINSAVRSFVPTAKPIEKVKRTSLCSCYRLSYIYSMLSLF